MAEEGSWDKTLQEWVVDEGYCYAAAMAQQEDGAFYAAAPEADDAGWGHVYADPQERDIMQDDGTTKKIMITEATQLHTTFSNLKAKKVPPTAPGGLWLGGKKYTITSSDPEFELGDNKYCKIVAQYPKHGVVIVGSTSQIVAAFYDEEKGQTAGNTTKTVLAFAEYLLGIGY